MQQRPPANPERLKNKPKKKKQVTKRNGVTWSGNPKKKWEEQKKDGLARHCIFANRTISGKRSTPSDGYGYGHRQAGPDAGEGHPGIGMICCPSFTQNNVIVGKPETGTHKVQPTLCHIITIIIIVVVVICSLAWF